MRNFEIIVFKKKKKHIERFSNLRLCTFNNKSNSSDDKHDSNDKNISYNNRKNNSNNGNNRATQLTIKT